MAARDQFHQAVKNGLIHDQWQITDDPLIVQFGGVDLYIDIGAEQLIAAEKGNIKIAVEIKSFLSNSALYEFHTALGQFLNYRLALREQDSQRTLYLAIPVDAYKVFFHLPFAQAAIRENNVKLIIYNPKTEAIVEWIN